MKYTYRNSAGHERTVEAPMDRPPPEEILIRSDGVWKPADDIGLTTHPSARPNHAASYVEWTIYARVFLPPMGHVRWEHPSWKKDGRPKGIR